MGTVRRRDSSDLTSERLCPGPRVPAADWNFQTFCRRCGLDDYEIEDFLTKIGLAVESFRVEADMPGGGGFSVFAWGSAEQEERSRSLIEKAIADLRELSGETDDDEA